MVAPSLPDPVRELPPTVIVIELAYQPGIWQFTSLTQPAIELKYVDLAMSIKSRVITWRNVGRFCASRISDYSDLLFIEFADAKARLIRELIAVLAMVIAGLFTLSFLCFAIIASAWQTAYFVPIVWAVAATWLLVSIGAFVVVRAQQPTRPFKAFQSELQKDLVAIKEATK
jgi:uncharacterized membrane protein YqjE